MLSPLWQKATQGTLAPGSPDGQEGKAHGSRGSRTGPVIGTV